MGLQITLLTNSALLHLQTCSLEDCKVLATVLLVVCLAMIATGQSCNGTSHISHESTNSKCMVCILITDGSTYRAYLLYYLLH
ncbi:hypothetical protein GDO78_002070 [Eleutherodactylus coqui]|uniref:Uncharacterized protein n=1 Tax=Eleutherodactylus coqui TaxID=57060 RepID=A0A8J6FW09_ELECQ|nr:hypothetical protein GDO78_002070 [Eleutherodactylus coqui]